MNKLDLFPHVGPMEGSAEIGAGAGTQRLTGIPSDCKLDLFSMINKTRGESDRNAQCRSVVIKLEFGAHPPLRGEWKSAIPKTINRRFLNGPVVSVVIRHAMLIKAHYRITATARLFFFSFGQTRTTTPQPRQTSAFRSPIVWTINFVSKELQKVGSLRCSHGT